MSRNPDVVTRAYPTSPHTSRPTSHQRSVVGSGSLLSTLNKISKSGSALYRKAGGRRWWLCQTTARSSSSGSSSPGRGEFARLCGSLLVQAPTFGRRSVEARARSPVHTKLAAMASATVTTPDAARVRRAEGAHQRGPPIAVPRGRRDHGQRAVGGEQDTRPPGPAARRSTPSGPSRRRRDLPQVAVGVAELPEVAPRAPAASSPRRRPPPRPWPWPGSRPPPSAELVRDK
jgi:hypothetical protein